MERDPYGLAQRMLEVMKRKREQYESRPGRRDPTKLWELQQREKMAQSRADEALHRRDAALQKASERVAEAAEMVRRMGY
jgi:hypothetical protein